MPIPTVTHLQFAVLSFVGNREIAGHKIREQLAEFGTKMSGPGFYQLMARLEGDGLVKGWYEQSLVDGQPIKERWYKLTANGRRNVLSTREFYDSLWWRDGK